jgi:hypothetical protein
MPRLISFLPLVLVPVFAQAHEGHGIDAASHYHATDALGFLAALAVVAALWWMGRGK